MSLPTCLYSCTRCSFSAAIAPGTKCFVFESGAEGDVQASTDIGWCFDCGTIREIQKALSPQLLDRKIQSLAEEIEEKQQRGSRGFLKRKEHPSIPYLRLLISERQSQARLLGSRCAAARCITCGRSSVVKMERPYGLKEILPFIHPNCGGYLKVDGREGRRYALTPQRTVLDLEHAIRVPTEDQTSQAPSKQVPRDSNSKQNGTTEVGISLTAFQHIWIGICSLGPAIALGVLKAWWVGVAAWVAYFILSGALGWGLLAHVPPKFLQLWAYIKNFLIAIIVLAAGFSIF